MYPPILRLQKKKKKKFREHLSNDAYAILPDFLYKSICCGYSFELHQIASNRIDKLMQFKWVPTT